MKFWWEKDEGFFLLDTGLDWKGLNTSNSKQHPQLHTTNAIKGLLLAYTIYRTPTGMDI